MKNKLLYLALALILTLALLAFVGCTQDPPVENPTSDDCVTTTAPDEIPTDTPTDTPTDIPTDATTTAPDEMVAPVEPDKTKVPDMAVTGKGYDIYQLPEDQDWGYRYGVTYLYNDDGSVDAYFACVGTGGEWDWISYRHSPDGGETWSDEKIVLTPTQGSYDHFSNCDPGVVYFGGYYYLGYTSTLNETGACNNVFVARSKNPDGPFEKWNGSGWGGYEPQPIFYYDEQYNVFGMGEPSFVELNGTLYIYYTNHAPSGSYTMVATADATNENWPATIQNHGAAVKKDTDSLDIKYVEEWGKFVGVSTGSRMGPSSYLAVFESNDGMHFELVDAVREGTLTHLHNAGLSSRRNGHIKLSEDAGKLRVIYAHGEGWGTWNTRVQPISLQLSDGNNLNAERAKPCAKEDFVRGDAITDSTNYTAMIRPEQDVYSYHLGRGSFTLRLNVYDAYFRQSLLKKDSANVTFKVHDESVCTVDNSTWKVTLVGAGTTAVEVWYGDLVYLFHVHVTEKRETGSAEEPVELVPVADTYTIYIGERSLYKPQLRAQMKWADGSFTEYYVTDLQEAGIMTFSDYDSSIISVTDKGVVTAKKVGETEVTLSMKGKTCKIKVVVSGDEKDSFFKIPGVVTLDYENLDFTQKGTESAITHSNKATLSYDETEGALKAVVTGEDALFRINMDRSDMPLDAADYAAIEIEYMSPADTSNAAINLQIFYCTGAIVEANAAYQVMHPVTKDGEYHTMTIDLTKLNGWEGMIHELRIDFYDQSEVGDTMYIKSITLIKK